MSEAADVSFLVIVLLVLAADLTVFYKKKTAKTSQTLFISVCLALDICARVTQLSIRIGRIAHNKSPLSYKDDSILAFHDFTQFLITLVCITLLSQWCWIYCVLTNPAELERYNKTIGQLTTASIIVVTVLIINDFVAIGID